MSVVVCKIVLSRKEKTMEDDYCGYCGYEGIDTWLITKREDFYNEDCDCEEHVECRNCGIPL